ncbi:MAG: MFS transporter, partial [Hyphococcus sp.]
MAATARSHLLPCGRGVIAAEPCPEELGRAAPVRQRRMILAACILASSMAFIDGSALTVALPALRDDLGASLSTVQWVVNAYVLSLAAFVLIGGALADVYGKARMLTIGCAGFAVASAACALAQAPLALIAARFAQGIAAAIVAPASLALIGATYPKKDRAKAIGVWASASALTTSGGPVLGGWLTQTFDWPAIFWLNPPIAAAAIALLMAARARDFPDPRRFDIPGAVILAAALGGLAWALSAIGPSEAGGAAARGLAISMESIGAGLAGAGLLAGYTLWERRSDHPMTPPRLFANRTLT